MGEQATLDKEAKAGNPQDTPVVAPVAQPDPAVVELQRKVEELDKKVADKDRYITELSNEKSTLEARLTQTQPKVEPAPDASIDFEAKRILETATVDPETAGKDLAKLIKSTTDAAKKELLQSVQGNLQPAIENISYANEIKAKNADLIELGFEPVISSKVNEYLQTGKFKTFKEAVDHAVKETREKVDKIKSNAPPTPPPKSAMTEDGANKLPETPPPPRQMTQEEEIQERLAKRIRMGLA